MKIPHLSRTSRPRRSLVMKSVVVVQGFLFYWAVNARADLQDAAGLGLDGKVSGLGDAALALYGDGGSAAVHVAELAPQLGGADEERGSPLAPVARAVGLTLEEQVVHHDYTGKHDDALVQRRSLVLELHPVGVGVGAQRLGNANVRHATALHGHVLLAVAVEEVPLGRAAGADAAEGAADVAHVLHLASVGIGLVHGQLGLQAAGTPGLLD